MPAPLPFYFIFKHMLLQFLWPIILLTLSLLAIFWYFTFFKPRQYLNLLLSKGAKLDEFLQTDQEDDLGGFKRSIQENPDIKLFVRQYPGRVSLWFSQPALVKEILTNHGFYSKLNKTNELIQMINSRGVTIAEGDNWKLHRKILSSAFQYDWFNEMIPIIVETTNDVFKIVSPEKQEIKVPIQTELVTSDVITRIFFDIKSRDIIVNGKLAAVEGGDVVRESLLYGMSPVRFILGMWALNISPHYRNLKKRIRNFRRVFREKIQERIRESENQGLEVQGGGRKDLLQLLLKQRKQYNNDPAQTLSDEEIIDEFMIFFAAGKDTTSVLITMSLYCYAKHPEWGQKLREEIDQTIQDPKNLSMDLLNSMNVLTAFFSEVLRLYPPGPIILPRIANRDHYVGEFFVKKGSLINTLFLASEYSPKYFKNPEEFNPGRWLKKDSNDEGWKTEPFSYLPFSAGPRNCIGKHLALMEAKVILSMIMKSYEPKIDPEYELEMGLTFGYGPKAPIPFTLIPRK